LLSTVAPTLACAFCPACLSAYSGAFSALGISATLGEEYHHYLLAFALLFTLGVQAYRVRVTRRLLAPVVAVAGCMLVVAGHAFEEHPWLVWTGIAGLLLSAAIDARVLQRSKGSLVALSQRYGARHG